MLVASSVGSVGCPVAGCLGGGVTSPLQSHCWLQQVLVVSICTGVGHTYYSGLLLGLRDSIRGIPGSAVRRKLASHRSNPDSSITCSAVNHFFVSSSDKRLDGKAGDRGRLES